MRSGPQPRDRTPVLSRASPPDLYGDADWLSSGTSWGGGWLADLDQGVLDLEHFSFGGGRPNRKGSRAAWPAWRASLLTAPWHNLGFQNESFGSGIFGTVRDPLVTDRMWMRETCLSHDFRGD
jgi:hypothetical protein